MTNVAVVVLDTLRFDAFDRAFAWLPGRRYTRAYSTSHWTIPAHASLFAGRYPSELGVHGKAPDLDCPDRTLAEALQAAGYRTRCWTANPQLTQYEGWDRGFDEFLGYYSLCSVAEDAFDWGECFASLESSGYRRHAEALLRCVRSDSRTISSLRQGLDLFTRSNVDGGAQDVLARLQATDFGDDEFLFCNLMETHTPYYPPEDDGDPLLVLAADAFSDGSLDLDRIREAYRTTVDYCADVYRDIYAELQAEFDYVITCSDHGELLGEHGLVNHSFGLYPELLHVPLVISGRDVASATDDRVVSLLDVHQTIAELAGVAVSSRGQGLLGERETRDYCFEYHGLLPFHEAQFEREDVPAAAYERRDAPRDGFVSADGAYVHETHTGDVCTHGDLDGDPEARLDELTGALDRRSTDEAAHEVTPAVRRQLEELGYA